MQMMLEIDCGNAAFDDDDCGAELARIMESIAGRLRDISNLEGGFSFSLHDRNGNRVGSAWFEGER